MRVRLIAPILLLAATLAANGATAQEPSIELRIEADGSIDLAGEHITDEAKFVTFLKTWAAKNPHTAIHIQLDKGARFEKVGHIIRAMQEAGIPKIGFITEPPK